VDPIAGIAVLDDGRLIVAGALGGRGAIERRTSAGGVDGSFGSGGVRLAPDQVGVEQLNDVLVDSRDRIVAAGAFGSSDGSLLVRLLADGTLDTSFGAGGAFTHDVPGFSPEGLLGVSETSAGYVAGGFHELTNDAYVIRVDDAGVLDPGFGGGDGVVDTLSTAGDDWAVHAYEVAGGKLLVELSGEASTRLARLDADGSLDGSFGTGGVVTTNGAFWNGARLESGDLVLAGSVTSGGDTDIRIQRYTNDGQPVSTFGVGGVRDVDAQPGGTDDGWFVAPGVDGDLLFVGSTAGGGDLVVGSLAGAAVDDYDDAGGVDWGATDAGFFGACLLDASAGATGSWTEAGTCSGTDGGNWHGVGTSAATVATTIAPTITAIADLRFAMRAASAQPQGTYIAPVAFSVIAPAA
jgi:uncharacterized delta-60 repeat protein